MNNILLLSLIALIAISIIQTTQAITPEERQEYDQERQRVINNITNEVATGLFKTDCNNNQEIYPEMDNNRCEQLKEMINNTTKNNSSD